MKRMRALLESFLGVTSLAFPQLNKQGKSKRSGVFVMFRIDSSINVNNF